MPRALSNPWPFRLWVALILLSQTAWAGALAEELVRFVLPPGDRPGGWVVFVAQKGYHVLLFGGMGALLALRPDRPSMATAAAWCVAFSVFAEALQALAPNRVPAVRDALLNVASALAAYALTARAAGRGSRPESPAHPRR